MSQFFTDLGRRIAEARRRAGLTQQQCADAVGIDRTSLANIEEGKGRMNIMLLSDLGIALDVRVECFLDDPPPAIISHWNNSDPDEPNPIIDRKLERVAREASYVWDRHSKNLFSPLPALELPQTPEAMEKCALEVRELLGYKPLEPTTGLLERAPDIGVLPFTFPLGTESVDGGSLLMSFGAVAVINGSRQYSLRRLTLAHQIGHCIFGDEYSVDWQVSYSRPDSHESRIGQFAIVLLLPADLLKTSWVDACPNDSLRTAAIITANKFHVGMSVLARRLHELDLIDDEQANEMRSFQTTKADVFELGLVIPPNLSESNQTTVPRRYEKIILEAYRQYDLSAARAAGLLFDTWDESELPESDVPEPSMLTEEEARELAS